jgi:predicted N-acetyltransferase YhbS
MPAHIRAAEKGDMEAVLRLLNEVFGAQQRSSFRRNERFWNWKYLENPFGQSLLTVAEVDGRIVGVDNLWPWEFEYRGSLIRAVQPCDSAVHPDFRGKGIFTSMRTFGLEQAWMQEYELVFNYPNQGSLPVNLSLGWHYLGRILWRVRILKPLAVLSARHSTGQTDPLQPDESCRIDPPRIHQVVSNTPPDPALIRIHRKPGFHAWRYEKHPSRSYGMVSVEHGDRSTVAIFTVNQKGPFREMVVVDLLGDPSGTLPVIRKAMKTARRMGVAYLALMDTPEFATRNLWRAGFLPRKLKQMVVNPLNPGLEGAVKHFSNWSLMAAMHDSI